MIILSYLYFIIEERLSVSHYSVLSCDINLVKLELFRTDGSSEISTQANMVDSVNNQGVLFQLIAMLYFSYKILRI